MPWNRPSKVGIQTGNVFIFETIFGQKKRFKVFFHFLLQIPFIGLNIVLTKKFIHLWNYMVRTTTYDLYFSQISDILTKTPNYKYTYTYLSTRTTLISIC